ncbi:phage protein NinX family protein [Proteus mirabilis]|uniref:phage protein NinX family protein n=1 Tax=Proteus mirabilis TaxID=584 RepID=UPI003558D331
MNKYTELSDFEINKKVAEELYYKFEAAGELVIVTKKYVGCVLPSPIMFDPCKNPADAMPIIIENKIGMNFVNNIICWSATHKYTTGGEIEVRGHRYYRIAMELFLLMKDAAKLNF